MSQIAWWCSTQSGPWTWQWRPYIGVWLIVALVSAWYFARVPPDPDRRTDRKRRLSFVLGMLTFVLAADWPIAALGASYLLSMHTLQYMLYAFAVPGLLIYALPRETLRRMVARTPVRIAVMFVNSPLRALIFFNFVLLASHLPSIVDGLTGSQFGSFAINMAWLASGFALWWHLIGPLPEWNPMSYPKRLLFLLANVFAPVVPASFMLFSKFPIYSTYELAVRVGTLTSIDDQRIAAMIMKVLGIFILIGIGSVLFFKWNKTEVGESATV